MNCFRYSLPVSPELRKLLEPSRGSRSQPSLPDRIVCHEFLAPAARQLIEPGITRRLAERCAKMIHTVLDLLSQDDRVQRSLGEYYGLRLLASEFESAIEHFQIDRDGSRFQRAATKLIRELNQPSSAGGSTRSDQFTSPALVHSAN